MKQTYTQKEFLRVEKHINKRIGKISSVLHGVRDDLIHLDICVIAPSKKHDFYTLVTLGMGAYRMNAASERGQLFDRIELIMQLPPDWKINSTEEKWRWPINLLAALSCYPIENDTWFEHGHTVSFDEKFEGTGFSSIFLSLPFQYGEKSGGIEFGRDDGIMFYGIIPIYVEEQQKINSEGNGYSFQKLAYKDIYAPLNVNRKNYGLI